MKKRILEAAEAIKDDRGFILILALVAMLAMTVIGISLIMNMTTELQMARNERDAKQAFNLAEAGVNEAIARLRVPATDANYVGEPTSAMTCAPAAPPCYRDPTWAGANSGNPISCTDGLGCSFTVKYLTEVNDPPHGYCDVNTTAPNTVGGAPVACAAEAGNGEVVMYGQDFRISSTITSSTIGKYPVFKIVSTGTSNNVSRRIEAFIGGSSLNTDIGSGISTNACFNPSGTPTVTSDIAGYTGTVIKEAGTGGCATCNDAWTAASGSCATKPSDNFNTYLTGTNLNDMKSLADEVHYCKGATCNAVGDDIPNPGAIDNLATPVNFGNAAAPRILYFDCTGRDCQINGNFTGYGIMVINGAIDFGGNFTYSGLIYATGTVTLSGGGAGSSQVTGGVMANGMTTTHGANMTVTYSPSTLAAVGRIASSKAMIGWRRM